MLTFVVDATRVLLGENMDHSPHKYDLQSSLEVMTLCLNPQDESLEGSGTHCIDQIGFV